MNATDVPTHPHENYANLLPATMALTLKREGKRARSWTAEAWKIRAPLIPHDLVVNVPASTVLDDTCVIVKNHAHLLNRHSVERKWGKREKRRERKEEKRLLETYCCSYLRLMPLSRVWKRQKRKRDMSFTRYLTACNGGGRRENNETGMKRDLH